MAIRKDGVPDFMFGHSSFEVTSAFHKALRRGDKRDATYWLEIMLQGGAPHGYIVKYLWQIAAEELAIGEDALTTYLAQLRANVDKLFPYHFYTATVRFCVARKWWECVESTEMRQLWWDNCVAIKEKRQIREIPHHAHDKHTTKGKKLLAEGKADRRWEGTWAGMWWRREAWQLSVARDVPINSITWDEVYGPEGTKGPEFLKRADYVEANVC